MPGLITKECEWAYPKEESFREQIRLIRKNNQALEYDVQNLSNHLREKYSKENISQMYIEFLDSLGPSEKEAEWMNQINVMSEL